MPIHATASQRYSTIMALRVGTCLHTLHTPPPHTYHATHHSPYLCPCLPTLAASTRSRAPYGFLLRGTKAATYRTTAARCACQFAVPLLLKHACYYRFHAYLVKILYKYLCASPSVSMAFGILVAVILPGFCILLVVIVHDNTTSPALPMVAVRAARALLY